MDTIRIALLKAVPKKWDVAGNWETVKGLVAEITTKNVDVICMPECFLDGYITPEKDWTPERFLDIAQEPTYNQSVCQGIQSDCPKTGRLFCPRMH